MAALSLILLWWVVVLGGRAAGVSLGPGWAWSGWLHAVLSIYLMLPPFIFGFALTVFPRWHRVPSRSDHRPAVAASALALVAVAISLSLPFGLPLLVAGLAIWSLVWLWVLVTMFAVIWRAEHTALQARLLLPAAAVGWLGALASLGWLITQDARWVHAAVQLGLWGFLLPLYLAVCHRMIPFFTECVHRDLALSRPPAHLWLIASAMAAHMILSLQHSYSWTWIPDAVAAVLVVDLSRRWRPFHTRGTPLLSSLHISFAWLAVGLAASAFRSFELWRSGGFLLGRAPEHMLMLGFVMGMLFAMVIRVTRGHSGRTLTMPRWAWLGFLSLQAVTVLRVLPELGIASGTVVMALTGVSLVAALAPWVVLQLPIYFEHAAESGTG